MKTSSTRQFGLAAAVASLVVLTTSHSLFAQPASDELKISTTAGAPLADILIPEFPGTGAEFSAVYAPGTAIPPTVAPGNLQAFIGPSLPGLTYVLFTEPTTEPVDPNELPPVTFNGPNGPVPVSDLLIDGRNVFVGPTFVALISDNNPDLATYVNSIGNRLTTILTETGDLQDLINVLPPPNHTEWIDVDVQVRSDITTVPEPSTLALVALGAVPMLIARRRLSLR